MERGRNEAARETAREEVLLQSSLLPRSSLHDPARVPAEGQDALAERRAPGAESSLHWDERPIALVDRGRLRVVSAGAARQRVRAGMSVAEAKAACAALALLPWEEDAVAAAVLRATAALVIASPQVTPVAGAPGSWWIGASGFERVGGERGLARALLRVARRWHPGARVAIAGSCVAARAAVWEGRAAVRGARAADAGVAGAVIVPAGGCAAYLAAAPLGLVPMDEELRLALHALGLRTAGALAALAPEDVERRWGAEGLLAWRLARGEDPRRPVLTRVEAAREVRTELASPAETTEPVLFLVRAALDRLCTTLAADGRAAAAVALTLTLDDGRGAIPAGVTPGAPKSGGAGGRVPSPPPVVAAETPVAGPLPAHTVTREIRPPVPVARVAPLFERCRALLDRWPLPAPVCAVAVAITATAPATGEQGSLLDTAWRDPAALDAALERLRAELGPNVVVRPAARDAHRPEAAGAWLDVGDGASLQPAPAMAPAPPRARMPDDATSLAAALRLLERPEPAEVECDADERPQALHWRGCPVRVARAAGPERLSGEWWTTASYRRDYWRCADDDGRELLVFQDHAAGQRWFVHGWYD